MNMGKQLFSFFTCFLLACLLADIPLCADNDNASKSILIKKSLIQNLQDDLSATLEIESTIQRRKAFKNIVRHGLSLIKKHPLSDNRFAVLGIIFQCQKELLILQNSKRNQEAIISTARDLLAAPDDYAESRLEADVLLMQWQLDSKGATEYQRALRLAKLADKYRDTPAEIDSLIVAAEIVFNLGHAELLKEFRRTLSTKFTGSPKAIGFLQERFAYKSSSLLFRGRFKDANGETLVLPIDRAGHVYLSCFWSNDTPGVKEKLMEINELQKKYNDRFEVLSFNLDELPDAGQSYLKSLDLDFRALHLPDGKNNKLFRSCSSNKDFLIRVINANGYIILTPIGSTYRTYGRLTDIDEYMVITLENDRFLSLTQTARIGDFLVIDPFEPFVPAFPPELKTFSKNTGQMNGVKVNWAPNDIPADALTAIQECFIPPPMRYRLTKQQALDNYNRAAKLCQQAIKQYPNSENLWVVYNRRIIALLGCWNLSGDAEYLRDAVKAANTVLGMSIPVKAQIVAKFCLVKKALRNEEAEPESLISDFIKSQGDSNAGGASIGAAVVLSLDAGSPALFPKYRDKLLDDHMDNPRLWSLTAYFFNKFTVSKFFRGNYYGSDVRVFHGFREWQKDTELRPRKFLMKLKNLKGETIDFPDGQTDKSNAVVFMDLPSDQESAKIQIDMVKLLETYANAHIHKNLDVTLAFVSADPDSVQALVKKNGWNASRIAFVPDGLRNPHVLRLGIFLPAKRPNTFMVAHDETIIWSMSGMYQMSAGTNAVPATIKEKTQLHDLSVGNDALQKGDFQKALKIFEGSFPPDARKPSYIKNAQLTGKSKAYKGLKNFKEAIGGYNNIVQAHTKHSSRSYCICQSLSTKLLLRADILESLGKKDQAAADRLTTKHLGCPPDKPRISEPARYESVIYNKIEVFKARKNPQGALDYINDIIVKNKDGKQTQRNEYAVVLQGRAEILENLDQSQQAKKDRLHAEALTKHSESNTIDFHQQDQYRTLNYVDIVKNSRNDY